MKKITKTFALMAITAATSTMSFAHDVKDGAGMTPTGMHNHSDHRHDDRVNKAGKPGVAENIVRTIHITMSDQNRFTPNSVKVTQGETIRFVVKNAGKRKHEMVIGSVEDIKVHNEMMARFPSMEHDEPNMVDLESGQTGEIIWQFTQAGQFQYACLVTGHLEAGVKGIINVVQSSSKTKAQTPVDHSTHQHYATDRFSI